MQNKYGVDTAKILMKLTYFGMLFGLAMPGIVVAIAYFVNGEREAPIPEFTQASLFFWMLLALAIVGIAVAFFLRKTLFAKPFIRSEEKFAADFATGVLGNFIVVYAFVDAVPLYGLVYNLMGGEFRAVMLFAILGVIAFQLLRPRQGFIDEALRTQERLVSEGRFGDPPGAKNA